MVGEDDLAKLLEVVRGLQHQVFRRHVLGQVGEVGDIRKHDRKLPALAAEPLDVAGLYEPLDQRLRDVLAEGPDRRLHGRDGLRELADLGDAGVDLRRLLENELPDLLRLVHDGANGPGDPAGHPGDKRDGDNQRNERIDQAAEAVLGDRADEVVDRHYDRDLLVAPDRAAERRHAGDVILAADVEDDALFGSAFQPPDRFAQLRAVELVHLDGPKRFGAVLGDLPHGAVGLRVSDQISAVVIDEDGAGLAGLLFAEEGR